MELSQIVPQNEKKKKKKSGGFQSMNLSHPVLRAVLKKGYKVPTPIQRKAIPVVMEGKNVLAMARTGSGKTAAFLIPMLEKLKSRTAKAGARALIFSPTRELAIQTSKFAKDLALYTGLKTSLILGGEKIEDQFSALHLSPDIIIATPGRFLHLVLEMDLKLSSVEYVVFDEADRLFEMGFQEQLQEVLNRLPSERQTLLFSATLPKALVNFVKGGIDDPTLIRLDVDLQISDKLKSSFLLCRTDDKTAILMHLLKNVVDLENELTVVFLATKHHIEYMKDILEYADIPCSYIYSSLDQMARTIHIAKFRAKKVGVLLVTDIAARGIDIPLLDNVINFNFPAKPKLYVHRVGRVARAGRSGRAFSLVAPDEIPYLLDLHLFLGNPITFANLNMEEEEEGVCGSVPQSIIDDEMDPLRNYHSLSTDLTNMVKVTRNAYQQYIKSRPAPSSESAKRMKELPFSSTEVHPIFKDKAELARNKILEEMKNYRPHTSFSKKAIIKNKQQVREEKLGKFRDNETYLKYVSSEHYKEKGLGLESNFGREAASAVLDLTGDEAGMARKIKNTTRWDRKKKKFVHENNDEKSKKMKTESGVWIPKSYKSDLYKKWQEKNKIKYQQDDNEGEDDGNQFGKRNRLPGNFKGNKKSGPMEKSRRPPRRELKNKEEILKVRNKKERLMQHQKKKSKLRANRKRK